MFTRAEIDAAEDTLDSTGQLMLLTVLRGSAQYKANPGYYPDLAGELAKMDGSTSALRTKAKMLNLAYGRMSTEVEFGTVKTSPTNKDNTDFDNVRDLEQLLDYCFNVLYDTGDVVLKAPYTSAVSGRLSVSSLRSGGGCPRCGGRAGSCCS